MDGGGGTAVRGEIHFLVCHFVCQDGEIKKVPRLSRLSRLERGRIEELGGDKERKKERGCWISEIVSCNAQTFFTHNDPAWTTVLVYVCPYPPVKGDFESIYAYYDYMHIRRHVVAERYKHLPF